jgi:transposase-like protein
VPHYARDAAFIERCQVHKKRNIVAHLPDEHKADVKKKFQNAYAMSAYSDAERSLEKSHRQLMDFNPNEAGSSEEGMEWTLTVHRAARAGSTLPDTHLHIVETVCRTWSRRSDQIECWGWLARFRCY